MSWTQLQNIFYIISKLINKCQKKLGVISDGVGTKKIYPQIKISLVFTFFEPQIKICWHKIEEVTAKSPPKEGRGVPPRRKDARVGKFWAKTPFLWGGDFAVFYSLHYAGWQTAKLLNYFSLEMSSWQSKEGFYETKIVVSLRQKLSQKQQCSEKKEATFCQHLLLFWTEKGE